jgi:G:T-mismatch repair DNA endonuclease (very short patch repair protein)
MGWDVIIIWQCEINSAVLRETKLAKIVDNLKFLK